MFSFSARLRQAAGALRSWPARSRFRRQLKGRKLIVSCGQPTIAFGEPAPQPGQIVHGGRIKLLHLRSAFSCSEENFNLLYLVSSAIPPFAEEFVPWARKQGARFVWNQNGVGFPAWAGSSAAVVNGPMTRLMHQADFVVYQSDFCQLSADRYVGKPSAPSAVLFNPVDLAAFSPAPQPPSLEEWRLLTAGTHNQAQRVLAAIETVRELRAAGHPARLTIAGHLNWPGAEGEVRAVIERCALSTAIDFHPRFTQAQAIELLRSSHLLLHPKYHDPCPTMVIEAMACGVPVIGSRSGGLPALIGDEGGRLIDVPLSWDRSAYPTPGEFAQAVIHLMSDWPTHRAAARARAERLFSSDHWVEEHRKIFTRLLDLR